MTMSSYNKFNNNILRDTLIVSIGNCFSSVFAGFGVFSFLGHMAYKNCMPVQDVVKSGPGLAFIAYPEAMSLLPASQLRFNFFIFYMNRFCGVNIFQIFLLTIFLKRARLDVYVNRVKTLSLGFQILNNVFACARNHEVYFEDQKFFPYVFSIFLIFKIANNPYFRIIPIYEKCVLPILGYIFHRFRIS